VNDNRNGGRCLKYYKRDRTVKAYTKACLGGSDAEKSHSDREHRKDRYSGNEKPFELVQKRITADGDRNQDAVKRK
jgi:hypothetical protein